MYSFDLSHFSIIKISGADSHAFLNAQLTSDVDALGVNPWLFTAWCSPKGRAISTFILFKHSDNYFLILPGMLREDVIRRLSVYILRSAVKIEDCSDDMTLIGVSGIDSESFINELKGDEKIIFLKMWNSDPRYFIVCPNDDVDILINELGKENKTGDRSAWSLLDIQAGMPWIISSTSDMYLPQMLNLDRFAGLNFKKGCYPGQEIVARVHFRGQLKKRLYLGWTEDNFFMPGSGDRLVAQNEKYAGDILDAEQDTNGRIYFLAVTDIALAGDRLEIQGEQNLPVNLAEIIYPAQ